MPNITLEHVYTTLWHISLLEVIQYYLFAFVFLSLLKFLLNAEISVWKFEVYNRRVLGGVVLSYVFLKSISLTNLIERDFTTDFSVLVVVSTILIVYLAMYRLVLEHFVTPILNMLIVCFKRIGFFKNLGQKSIPLYTYRINLKHLWYFRNYSKQDTMAYLRKLSLNLIAVIILTFETASMNTEIGVWVAIYCAIYFFYSWKYEKLKWITNLNQSTEFHGLIYKADVHAMKKYRNIPKNIYYWVKQKIKYGWKSKIIFLTLIPAPDEGTRAVLAFENENVRIRGQAIGSTTLICGNCKAVLAENISDEMIRNIIIRCGKCQSHNEVPMAWNRYRLRDIEEKFSIPMLVTGLLLVFASLLIDGETLRMAGIIISVLSAVALLFTKTITKIYSEDSK